jgi:hypothetical protein
MNYVCVMDDGVPSAKLLFVRLICGILSMLVWCKDLNGYVWCMCWSMICCFSLYCCDIFCHMHHRIFLITLVHNVFMQRFRGSSWKFVCKGIWGLFYLIMHTSRGSSSLNRWIHTSLSINQIVLSSITKKGGIESASRLLIVLVIMTMQVGRIHAFNEMCAGFKVK